MLGLWFVLQWAYAIGPASPGGVAYVAHVFGFVFGLLVRVASAEPRPAQLR